MSTYGGRVQEAQRAAGSSNQAATMVVRTRAIPVGAPSVVEILAFTMPTTAVTANASSAALRSLSEVSARAGISEDVMLDQILAGQALPGLMEPEDVANLYLFLASDLANNITGQAVNVDRGEVMA